MKVNCNGVFSPQSAACEVNLISFNDALGQLMLKYGVTAIYDNWSLPGLACIKIENDVLKINNVIYRMEERSQI